MLIKVSKDLTSVTAIENGEKYTFGLRWSIIFVLVLRTRKTKSV